MARIYAIGPWDDEPDEKRWEAFNLRCLILRTPNMGNLCGYVGVPEAHALYGFSFDALVKRPDILHGRVDLDEIGVLNVVTASLSVDPKEGWVPLSVVVNCHGGLTYANKKDDGWWYFGFDCAHAGDLVPAMQGIMGQAVKRLVNLPRELQALMDATDRRSVYRNIDYVTNVTTNMAEQLGAMADIEVKEDFERIERVNQVREQMRKKRKIDHSGGGPAS